MFSVSCFAQQYGWVDLSDRLPVSNGTASLSDMHWISDNEGWICSGATGEIYHSIDGGQTFEIQTTQFYTNAIYMLNAQVGYAGGYNGRVYKTINGGANWTVHGSIGGTLLDIDFPPESDSGYCCGYNGRVYKISESGLSAMSSGVNANLASISFSESIGWTCGENVIIRTNGIIWYGDQSYSEGWYNTISMIDNQHGWAAGDGGAIINTNDGEVWNDQFNPDILNRALINIFFINQNIGWAVGNNGVVLYTSNGGTDWNIILDGWTTQMLRSVQFTSSNNGYILGNNGTFFKYGALTNTDNPSINPKVADLKQNYPNPFNPQTSISYTLNQSGHVKLSVYNLHGKIVCELADEEQNSGLHTVSFNALGLPSGIYYYQLRCGDQLETRKMVLLK